MIKKKIDALTDASDALWKSPSKVNWEKFSKLLKGRAVYYRVIFEHGKIKKNEDITKSFVEIWDSKRNVVCKVPLFLKDGRNIVGATIYLKGLQILNGV